MKRSTAQPSAAPTSQTWIQAVGTRQSPLQEQWIEHGHPMLRHVWSSREPTGWSPGDLVVYYASRLGKLVAIMEIAGDVEDLLPAEPDRLRWRYRVPVRPLLALAPDVAPSRHEVGVSPPQTYKRLSPEEYQRTLQAMFARLAGL